MHKAEHLMKKMKDKGWSEEEIQHAHEVFSEHKDHHHIIHKNYDKVLQWAFFFTIILGGFLSFFFLLPLLFFTDSWISYIIVALFALILGLVFEVVINDFTHLEGHHHFLFGGATLILLFTIFLILQNFLQTVYNVFIKDAALNAIIYSLFFMLPYYIRQITKFKN